MYTLPACVPCCRRVRRSVLVLQRHGGGPAAGAGSVVAPRVDPGERRAQRSPPPNRQAHPTPLRGTRIGGSAGATPTDPMRLCAHPGLVWVCLEALCLVCALMRAAWRPLPAGRDWLQGAVRAAWRQLVSALHVTALQGQARIQRHECVRSLHPSLASRASAHAYAARAASRAGSLAQRSVA